jgi:F-type H+-transporting ATPase subunit delta
MANHAKAAHQLARQLFTLSLVDGALSAERVGGVLEYVEKHAVANPVMVLRAYQRLVATEVAKGVARVEHAGPVSDATLAAIAAAMSGKYRRPVTAVGVDKPDLLAGLRVHVGDDIYETSIAGQLATLTAAT